METIRNILGLDFNSEERKKYNANAYGKRISEVIISGTKISGYGAFSFLWEKSYVKSPTRSGNGSIGNLNSYATFITPHLQIDFSLLDIDNYRKIMQLLYSKNEHEVQCYDIVNDRTTINNMYFATESMPKLLTITRMLSGASDPIIELIGVQDYTVEMIGTNTQLGKKTITYNPAIPPQVGGVNISPITIDVVKGQEIIIGEGAEDIYNLELTDQKGNLVKFFCWSSVKDDYYSTLYRNGDTLFIYDSVEVYALWIESNLFTLSYDYGLGEPQLDENGNPIYTKQIRYGETFGTLYNSPMPTVTFDGITYNPYTRKGWYYTPSIVETSTRITSDTKYELRGNYTIYQIFEPLSYTLTFVSNGGNNFSPITAQYGSLISVGTPKRDGYKFDGWYYDDVTFAKPLGNTMPPVSKTVYAKWSKNE